MDQGLHSDGCGKVTKPWTISMRGVVNLWDIMLDQAYLVIIGVGFRIARWASHLWCGNYCIPYKSPAICVLSASQSTNYDELAGDWLADSRTGFTLNNIKTTWNNYHRPEDGPAIRKISKQEKPKKRRPDEWCITKRCQQGCRRFFKCLNHKKVAYRSEQSKPHQEQPLHRWWRFPKK